MFISFLSTNNFSLATLAIPFFITALLSATATQKEVTALIIHRVYYIQTFTQVDATLPEKKSLLLEKSEVV